MTTLLFNLFARDSLSNAVYKQLENKLSVETGQFELRQFPDGESYLRITSDCQDKTAVILADMHQPNSKFLPLIFLCESLREMGVQSIYLLCPYLPYMRQDIQFKRGECVTSRYFARQLSQHIDGLVTIDPHLHRYHSLDEIYSVKSVVSTANDLIANWVKNNVDQPLVVGPDSESEQWAARAAEIIGCPYMILEKERKGDKNVVISAPEAHQYLGRTPVLIDDIISTGRTMIVTAEALIKESLPAPVCIGVHALFSEDAYSQMQQAPIANIYTCDTVSHPTNMIDSSALLATGLLQLVSAT